MVLLPLVIGLYKYRSLPTEYRIIVLYLILNGVISIITDVLASYNISNMVLFHLFTVIEMILFSVFFTRVTKNDNSKKNIKILTVAFLIFAIVNVLFWQDLSTYNSYTRSLEAILLIFYAILNLSNIFDASIQNYKLSEVNILIMSGILMYFASSLIIFIIYDVFFLTTLATLIWNTHATFLLIMYILFAIGLWKYKN